MASSGVCGICQSRQWQPDELQHLPIYVNGSEGIALCPDCCQALTNHVSAMRSAANRAYMAQHVRAAAARKTVTE